MPALWCWGSSQNIPSRNGESSDGYQREEVWWLSRLLKEEAKQMRCSFCKRRRNVSYSQLLWFKDGRKDAQQWRRLETRKNAPAKQARQETFLFVPGSLSCCLGWRVLDLFDGFLEGKVNKRLSPDLTGVRQWKWTLGQGQNTGDGREIRFPGTYKLDVLCIREIRKSTEYRCICRIGKGRISV